MFEFLTFPKGFKFPFNIYNDNDRIVYEFAMAGYSLDNIEAVYQDGILTVEAKPVFSEQKVTYVHKGISGCNHKGLFPIPPPYKVESSTYKDGILKVIFIKSNSDKEVISIKDC